MEQAKSKPRDSNIDDLVKSRHSGENRSPENLQLFEKTGFRLPAFAGTSFARKPHFQTSYEFIKFWGANFFAEGKELPTGHEENGRESRLVDS
jgi:hypothetical protein